MNNNFLNTYLNDLFLNYFISFPLFSVENGK